MRSFTVLWLGQLISLLGTALAQFAIIVWAWELTGSATALAMVSFCSFAPMIALGPVAGALVDRWDRRRVMILSDLGASLAVASLLALHLFGSLQLWHIYVAVACAAASQAFQFPAFTATAAALGPKSEHGRTGGMISLAETVPFILGPLLGAFLLKAIGMAGVIALDLGALGLALLAFLWVRIPTAAELGAERGSAGSLWADSLFGFRYMFQKPGLFGMQVVLFVFNLTSTLSVVLLAPLILARTGDNASALGLVQAGFGVGGAAGGVAIALWGGPSKRIHGFLLSVILCGLLGRVVVGAGQAVPVWLVGTFCAAFFGPVINGCFQSIWQAKVPPDLQGRVFATRRLLAQLSQPIATALAGPLADRVMEPGMTYGGTMAALFGPWVGTGPGAGIGLIWVATGVAGAVVALAAYGFHSVREVERLNPDYDHSAATA